MMRLASLVAFRVFRAVPTSMRRAILLCLACGLLLASCAPEGTILRKEYRPLPFAGSLGISGIFRFELRLRSGEIRSQMVTPDVFDRYEVGEYFNDRAQPAFRGQPSMRPEAPLLDAPGRRRPLEELGTPYRQMPPPAVEGAPMRKEVRRAIPVRAVAQRRELPKGHTGATPTARKPVRVAQNEGVEAIGFRHAAEPRM